MEELITTPRRQKRLLPTASEIQAIVEEILASKEASQPEEVKPEMETTKIKPEIKSGGRADLNETALRVLERRYLKKDAEGKVIEKPEAMFRRVAEAIAAAEVTYDARADAGAREEEFYRVMTGLAAFGLLCPARRRLDGVYL